MRHYLKTGIIALVVGFFMNQVCFAEPLSFLDWRQDMPSIGDTIAMGAWRAESPCDECPKRSGGSGSGDMSSEDYGQWHKYLGYSAVGLAALAAVSSNSRGLHCTAAYGAAMAAAGAATTGLMAYQDRFNPENGLADQNNAHIVLGTLGAISCLTAVALSAREGKHGHAAAGILGGGAMAAGIITIKW